MHHVAILEKSRKLLPKILSGKKYIETRWYKSRFSPWNRIRPGDIVYFKDAGLPVTAMAEVEKVEQAADFSDQWLSDVINTYGGEPGICFSTDPNTVFSWARKRRYAILVFLRNPQIVEPFDIDKTSFGNACAWLTVENVENIKK